MRRIHKGLRSEDFRIFEKPWIIKIVTQELLQFAQRHGRRLSPSEQIMLDAGVPGASRIRQFDSYFHRLSNFDQILLLLKDKYHVADADIATALGVPEGALKVRRQQALRALEDWIWG